MSGFGYSKRHLYKDAVRRRLFTMRRFLAKRGTGIDKRATAATVYWVGDEDSDFYNAANWASSSGGVGGAGTGGVPKNTTHVVFDGNHTNGCVLGALCAVANLTFVDTGGSPAATFDQNGKQVTCAVFAYNVADDQTVVLDGILLVAGATFTITAMHATAASAFLAGGSITLFENCTMVSAVPVPWVSAAKNFTTTGALTAARLTGAGALSTFTFKESANFTLTAYTLTDWDAVTIVSATPATAWDFVNPAAMVVSDVDVTDSNATNEVDATDGGVDGTGNTNWTFV